MLRKYIALFFMMFTVAIGTAACTSHPDDKGDVTGRNMQNTPRAD